MSDTTTTFTCPDCSTEYEFDVILEEGEKTIKITASKNGIEVGTLRLDLPDKNIVSGSFKF